MNAGEADETRAGGGSFGEGDFAPFDFSVGRPAEVEFDDGLAGAGGGLVGIGDFAPAGRIGGAVGGVFGFGVGREIFCVSLGAGLVAFDAFAIFITPMDADESAAARAFDVFEAAEGGEFVKLAAFDRKSFLEVTFTFDIAALHHERAFFVGAAVWIYGEGRADFVAR